jgi:glycosyltransferase involved in cell wall biosynthesis
MIASLSDLKLSNTSQVITGGIRTHTLNLKQGSEKNPLVTIITIVFNDAKHLQQTIDCVKNQSYSNIEYIVVDGGSKDGTLDVILNNAHFIDYFVSEPDKGIADAWNKGLQLAKGDIIGLLNCADFFEKNSVELVVANLIGKRHTISYGNTWLVDKNDQSFKLVNGKFSPNWLFAGMGFLHPSCFATKDVYEKVGLFSLRYKLAMDCDWLLRCYRAGIVFIKTNNFSYMRNDGLSNQSIFLAYGEFMQALNNNGFSDFYVFFGMMIRSIRGLFVTTQRKFKLLFIQFSNEK